jgi:pyridoxine 5-phosphate synthase
MTRLSVNINKVATLRNARGANVPDVVQVAVDCERFGAQGITVHPRPDGRHIRRDDVVALRKVVTTEFNIEGNPERGFIDLVLGVLPEQVTLVPDSHDALTSSAGWNTRTHRDFLREVIQAFRQKGIRVSVFVDAAADMVRGAAEAGADRVELYTEPYAAQYVRQREAAVAPFVEAAREAAECGIGLNAGHDLNLENLHYFSCTVPNLLEVSIGHALISDALYLGLEETIRRYKQELRVKNYDEKSAIYYRGGVRWCVCLCATVAAGRGGVCASHDVGADTGRSHPRGVHGRALCEVRRQVPRRRGDGRKQGDV